MRLRTVWEIIKTAAVRWVDDSAPRLGAALSYYTVFAISPLFLIIIYLASLMFDETAVRTALLDQVGSLIGKQGAKAVQSVLEAAAPKHQGYIASIIAGATLLVTATGVFVELQTALNRIWGVREKPGQGIMGFIKNRLLSLAMVLGIGFILLVSLVLSTALAAGGKYVSGIAPDLTSLWAVVNGLASLIIVTLLFAMIYKILPDVHIAWRDVWVGAAITSLLFTAGKFLLGVYLGRSSTVSAYGAAGSVVLILLWVYYSAQILFFGAELTLAWADRFGVRIQPKANAEWINPPAPETGAAPPDRKQKLVSELRRDVENLRSAKELTRSQRLRQNRP